MRRLAYLANIRLPTEKAHGFQICKMCEAFALQETAVSLYHPKRIQTEGLAGKTGQDSFDYYGIQPNFKIISTPNLDIIRFQNQLPKKLYRGVYQLQAALWSRRTVKMAPEADIFYTRDFEVAQVLTQLNYPTVLEAHAVPKGRNLKALEQTVKRPSFRLGVVLTQFIKRALIEAGAHPAKVLVEPDAVDLAQYRDLPTAKVAKAEVGLPQDQPIIGYIGRFKTMGMDKGIRPLVEMMARLPKADNPPLLLCVGGPLDHVHDYLALADSLGVAKSQLKFIDRVPNGDVPKWIAAIDIATMPYPFTEHYAYFMSPMKLFEYLAAGKAIVSTDLPSIQEILVDGKNGRFVSPNNPQAFADVITELLTHPEQKRALEQQALADAQSYSWAARAKRILEAVNG